MISHDIFRTKGKSTNVLDHMSDSSRSRSRNWVFTLNNPPKPYGLLVVCEARYLVYQLEKGEAGTLHYQGLVTFETLKSFKQVKKNLPDAHLEPMMGTVDEAVHYNTKPHVGCTCKHCAANPERVEGPWVIGEKPMQGRRSDILAVKAKIDSGATEKAIADEFFGTWCRSYRAFERYRRLSSIGRDWQTKVHVFWGPSGSGKSRQALALGGSSQFWVVRPRDSRGGVWWDGYEGQDTVVIDEFYGWMSRDFTQRLCDRYPLVVETKGGAVPFAAKRIIFTSNKPPSLWWKMGLGAMARRLEPPIGEVKFFGLNRDDPFEEANYRTSLVTTE